MLWVLDRKHITGSLVVDVQSAWNSRGVVGVAGALRGRGAVWIKKWIWCMSICPMTRRKIKINFVRRMGGQMGEGW
jgi:hypothetical protein